MSPPSPSRPSVPGHGPRPSRPQGAGSRPSHPSIGRPGSYSGARAGSLSSAAGGARQPSNVERGHERRAGSERANERAPERAAGRSRSLVKTTPMLAAGVGFVLASLVGGAVVWGCRGDEDASAEQGPRRTSALLAGSTTASARAIASLASATASASSAPSASASAAASVEPEPPYNGPMLGALALQTPVYASMEFSKKRLGYLRYGGRAPVDPQPIKASNCKEGWYRLLDGGYVCGRYATVKENNPQLKLGVTAPNLNDLLPYKYAYNTAHGTPLYKSVPSREDMLRYEPYLEAAKKAKKKRDEEAAKQAAETLGVGGAAEGPGDAGATPEDETTKPWWQTHEPGKPLSVKLSDLEQDADGTVAKRMVKGFFVAVDKPFGWNDRLWYKTTSGLVAPADRMVITKPPASKGVDVPAGVKQVGFITSAKGTKFQFDDQKSQVKVVGPVPRLTGVPLTGATHTHKDVLYRQTVEGWWMKATEGTWTEPAAPPANLAPGEKWIDVNLTRKTLVAYEGDRPVFAALVSPGKRSKNKQKDHPTVQGTFRIREKHIATTMDGDGTAAGDLPYSIEDVPYVAYFEGSYALHGAFWHSDFGRERSHGCVNLSPLDAKWVFVWSEPRLPRGWHGVWATPEKKGTLVVVHE